jgi:uncharacterized protein involved in response to NO
MSEQNALDRINEIKSELPAFLVIKASQSFDSVDDINKRLQRWEMLEVMRRKRFRFLLHFYAYVTTILMLVLLSSLNSLHIKNSLHFFAIWLIVGGIWLYLIPYLIDFFSAKKSLFWKSQISIVEELIP